MPLAELGGRTLYYERRGTPGAPPLLLIQGMAGHHGIWGEPLLRRLEQDFDLVAYDHRGVGDSTDVPGPFTTADLAADAAAVLDVIGWHSAHVFGISLGGMVAQELALTSPERVRALVLGCTYAGGAGSTLDAPGPMRMLEAMNTGDAEASVRAAFHANLSPEYTADESRFEPFMTAALSVVVPVELVLRQAQSAFLHNTSDRLPALNAPTLVLHGDADDMVRYSNGVQIAKLVPGARLHTFQGVGHLFWWERPNETADLIRGHCLR
jgi:pimeloyl-ACP methyl ester carboxylesterase